MNTMDKAYKQLLMEESLRRFVDTVDQVNKAREELVRAEADLSGVWMSERFIRERICLN